MATYNYAEKFERDLQQKYARKSTSDSLFKSNPNVKFINAQTIKLPNITISGYKDHNRENLGFNAGTISNDWEPKKLEHDRDIELYIDPMDVDETNLTVEMANVTNTFENEQVIPETDAYTYSKLYSEAVKYKTDSDTGSKVDTTVLTKANILDWFDDRMAEMDDAGVPEEGRELRITSSMLKLLKQADGIQRTIDATKSNNIDRRVHSIDDVTIIKVPSGRFKTKYNFTNGFVPDAEAKQINIMLCHPSCQVSRRKYSYINVFTPGHDSRTADKYLYQNRKFWDSFIIKNKACGMAINVEA
jgi:hypothetical protein|nr:MAG TPA: major capsid protein [Caudoviricetes sp.]